MLDVAGVAVHCDEFVHYLTLSYCWGTPDSSPQLFTTTTLNILDATDLHIPPARNWLEQ